LRVKSFQVAVGHNFEKWRSGGVRRKSYFSKTSQGGGVIFELVHEINLINNLFGKILTIQSIKSKSSKFNCEDVVVSVIKTNKSVIGTLYQDMFSNYFFRYVNIVTRNKFIKIDFKKNQIIENQKVIKFKNLNDQFNLLMRNMLKFIKKIKRKEKSILDYDESVNDLNICIKMHNEL